MNVDDRWVCSRCLRVVTRGQICGNCGFSEADYRPKPHQLPPEALLKQRYLVASVLGEGGFGITYAGWDLTLDKPVAIKEYFPAGLAGRDASKTFSAQPQEGPGKSWFYAGRERFLREARMLAMLSGVRGIVPVRDFFEENDTAYIVMDFIHGESLRQRADRSGGKIAPTELLPLLRPVFDALILVHQSGILHRDISPENILVDRTGTAWLIDFGAAEELLPSDDLHSHAVILRKGYTPLEQYDSHGQQGPWSDLYALAATIYDLLCAQTPPEAILRVEKDLLLPPRKRGVSVTRAQQRALLSALSPQVSDRQTSIDQFRSELYGLPLPADLARRRRFLRRAVAVGIASIAFIALFTLNATTGLPSAYGCGISLANSSAVVQSYYGRSEDAVLPARYLGLPVEAISQEAFHGKSSLANIAFPHYLKEIQDMAFLGCSSLQNLVIPQGVTHIGAYVFADCSALETITLPDSVTDIADSAFAGCSPELVLLGGTQSYTQQYAERTGLLFCDPTNFEYAVSGDNAIIMRYTGSETRVVVPSTIYGIRVSAIGKHAFASSAVETVVLASGIAQIEEGAFASCYALREVTLPQSLKTVGDLAFHDCGVLSTVNFGDGLESIGKQAFSYDRALTDVALPDSLRSIGDSAFEGCIGLTQINIPAHISHLPEGVFYYCDRLAEVAFAEGLASLGARVFEGCVSLANVKLPDSVTQIGFRAFAGCAALSTIYVPSKTVVIDPSAFGETDDIAPLANPDLVLIGAPGSAVEAIAEQTGLAFDDISLWADESLLAYERNEDGMTITGYYGDADQVILPSYIGGLPVTTIGVDAFYDCSCVHTIVLPRLLKTILNSAFSYCPNLNEIEFPDSLQRIDYYAFYRCNLGQVTLPSSLTTLGYNAFDSNPNLSHVSLGTGLAFLDETAFTDCPTLETLEIASAASVSGFSDLPALRAVTLGDGVGAVRAGAFANCPLLKDVYLSSTVRSIAPDAFDKANVQLTIHAGEGTYAETFARENGFRFERYP